MSMIQQEHFYPPKVSPLMVFPLAFGLRPLRRKASAIIHCSCPLVLRNSSAAHFSMASIVSASIRSTKLFVLDSFAAIMNCLVMKCSCIYHRLRCLICTKDYKQIAYHCCLALLIQLNNLLSRESFKGNLDH